jgi:hypothetical protein
LAVSVGVLEDAAIDAVGFVRVLDPEVLDPRLLVRGGCMLPFLTLYIVSQNIQRSGALEDLRRARCFASAARMDRDGGDALINSVREQVGASSLVLATEQRAKVQDEFLVECGGRLETGLARLATSRDRDPIGGKSVPNQIDAHAVGCIVVVEHSE